MPPAATVGALKQVGFSVNQLKLVTKDSRDEKCRSWARHGELWRWTLQR